MVKPYKSAEPKVEQIKRMFDGIAPSYDKLNRIISLGLDISWRRAGIDMLAPYAPKEVLDVATGTGDLSIELLKSIPSIEHICAVDLSEEMMRVGQSKVEEFGLVDKIDFERQDCTALTYESESFDAVTIAFGIRNFPDIPRAASEIYRVLRPGKPFLIIELSEPTNPVVRMGYRLYSNHFIPLMGRLFSSDNEAYRYLPKSIGAVPQREDMVDVFTQVGFSEVYYHSITPGTCTIYIGIK